MNLEDIRKKLSSIQENSTVTITSFNSTKEDFILEKTNPRQYKLYISNKVKSIHSLFCNNSRVRNIFFDNWDTSNLEIMSFAFSNIELDEIDDFSKLDLSNLNYSRWCFSETYFNKDFTFKNNTLNSLESIAHMFSNVYCKTLIIDIKNTPKLQDMSYLCYMSNIKKLTISILNSYDDFDAYNLIDNANIEIINLKNVNLSRSHNIRHMLKYTVADEIYMPENAPVRLDGFGYLDEISDKIGKIYCNEEWLKFIDVA